MDRLESRLEREIDPLLGKVKEVGGEATRVAKLGAAQVERSDLLMTGLIRRVEEVIGAAQRLIVEPVRQALRYSRRSDRHLRTYRSRLSGGRTTPNQWTRTEPNPSRI